MQVKSWQVVKNARKFAEYQLRFYTKMMNDKNENQDHNLSQGAKTAQNPDRVTPWPQSWET